MTAEFDAMSAEFEARGERLTFVVNQSYGDAVQRLIDVAKINGKATGDPASRLLQVLARVKTADGPLRL